MSGSKKPVGVAYRVLRQTTRSFFFVDAETDKATRKETRKHVTSHLTHKRHSGIILHWDVEVGDTYYEPSKMPESKGLC